MKWKYEKSEPDIPLAGLKFLRYEIKSGYNYYYEPVLDRFWRRHTNSQDWQRGYTSDGRAPEGLLT